MHEPDDTPLVPISTFARLTGLTPRALRLYDRQGLFHPAFVDDATGYRYYAYDQFPDAEAIHLLRSFDVPLATVRAALDSRDPAQWRAILEKQQDDLRKRLTAIQRLLHGLERTLSREIEPVTGEVELRQVPARVVVSARRRADPGDLEEVYADLLETVTAQVGEHGLLAAGREIVIYNVHPRREDAWDLELAQPVVCEHGRPGVARRATGGGPTEPSCSQLPAETLAVVRHMGPYEDSCLSAIALLDWIASHDYRLCGPEQGTYPVDDRDTDDQRRWVTEIAWPVERIASE